jgi:DNA polymerase-4
MEGLVSRQAVSVAERLRKSGLSGRTVTLKVRLHDFTTLSRSTTLTAPTDAGPAIARLARGLLGELDLTGGVRLLGVGVSGLADWIQDDLFGGEHSADDEASVEALPDLPDLRTWVPGMDVVHEEHGRGWVWGAGRGIVTVRFETAQTPPGPVRSLPADDPALTAWREST